MRLSICIAKRSTNNQPTRYITHLCTDVIHSEFIDHDQLVVVGGAAALRASFQENVELRRVLLSVWAAIVPKLYSFVDDGLGVRQECKVSLSVCQPAR